MICEHLNTCGFIASASRVMPFTAVMIKAIHCKDAGYGCAKNKDHEVLVIDKERGNLWSGTMIEGLEIFEKEFSKSYKKLCVRGYIETARVQRFDMAALK